MNLKVITCVAVERYGKFLVLKREKKDSYPELWEFPSGKLESKEELIKSAKRELLEEAGLKAKKLEYRGCCKRRLPGDPVTVVHYFHTSDFEGKLKLSEEHTAFRWLTKKQILKMDKLKETDTSMDSRGKIGMDAVNFFKHKISS